jgi:hypothetical protein
VRGHGDRPPEVDGKVPRFFNYAVTERVGNVQVHPHWGLLPGLLWIE